MLAEYDEEYNEGPFFDDDEEDEDEPFEADPSVVAAMDQEGAEFEAQRAQFTDMYGFDHNCHCAKDYSDGALAQVTECYLELTDDALETCARLNWENQTLQGTGADPSAATRVVRSMCSYRVSLTCSGWLELMRMSFFCWW